jgi:hypothetical protein
MNKLARAKYELAKLIDQMDDEELFNYLRIFGFEPEDLSRIDEALRAKIYEKLDNPPGKAAEIARLMEKSDA